MEREKIDKRITWVELLPSKYLKGDSLLWIKEYVGCSYTWSSIMKVTEIL